MNISKIKIITAVFASAILTLSVAQADESIVPAQDSTQQNGKVKSRAKKGTHEVGHGAKEVGKGTKDLAVAGGQAVGNGAKKAGRGAKKVGKKAGSGIKNTAQKVDRKVDKDQTVD